MAEDMVFVAVTNFSVAGERFRAGEVVPASSLALGVVLRHGGRFVVPKSPSTPGRVRRDSADPSIEPVEPPVVAPDQPDQPHDGDVESTGE